MAEIVSPIAKVYKEFPPCSKSDYEEQVARSTEFGWMWDGDSASKARIGDRFGFVFNRIRVQWHTITDIKNPNERLPSWSNNVGQSNRKVLILSDVESVENFNTFTQRHGYSENFILRGTMYIIN